MEWCKDNWIRLLYLATCAVMVAVAVVSRASILEDPQRLNHFGYIGGVATLVGLVVAILEIVHGARVAKSIRRQVGTIIDHSRALDRATLVTDCLSSLDEAVDHVAAQRFAMSLKCVQYVRKNCMRLTAEGPRNPELTECIGNVELGLLRCSHAKPNAPATKRDRVAVQRDIVRTKSYLERLSPMAGATHVA